MQQTLRYPIPKPYFDHPIGWMVALSVRDPGSVFIPGSNPVKVNDMDNRDWQKKGKSGTVRPTSLHQKIQNISTRTSRIKLLHLMGRRNRGCFPRSWIHSRTLSVNKNWSSYSGPMDWYLVGDWQCEKLGNTVEKLKSACDEHKERQTAITIQYSIQKQHK